MPNTGFYFSIHKNAKYVATSKDMLMAFLVPFMFQVILVSIEVQFRINFNDSNSMCIARKVQLFLVRSQCEKTIASFIWYKYH